jgi:hypothetical protein
MSGASEGIARLLRFVAWVKSTEKYLKSKKTIPKANKRKKRLNYRNRPAPGSQEPPMSTKGPAVPLGDEIDGT